jgi:hypothetical protein
MEQRAAGHVLAAYASPTLEVMVTVDPVAMQKRFDPETNLTLIDPGLQNLDRERFISCFAPESAQGNNSS